MHHKKLLSCLLLLSVEFKNFFKSRPFLVFLGDDELHVRCDRPLYADRLIIHASPPRHPDDEISAHL